MCAEPALYGTLFCLECGATLLDVQPASANGAGRVAPPQPTPVVQAPASRPVENQGPLEDQRHVAEQPAHTPEALPAWLEALPDTEQPAELKPQVRLFVTKSRRMTALPSSAEVRLGRVDAKRNVHPELDFTADGGLDAGVSRLHAVILRQNGEALIMDLSSTNGTRVNDVELAPNRPQPLHDGDEIELGALKVRVYLDL
jgi:hypothetical protein